MNAFAAALLLAASLAGGRSFPKSGDACKDACEMTRLACEDECLKEAKEKNGSSKACMADCDQQVVGCAQVCPAAMKQARQQMREQGIPEPQPDGK